MKKIFFSFVWFISAFQYAFAISLKNDTTSLESKMLPENSLAWVSWSWKAPLVNLFSYAKNFIFSILWLIVIWTFLYLWFVLITSKWKPDDFKKALMWLVYAIVWLAIIPIAYAAVKIISSLNL